VFFVRLEVIIVTEDEEKKILERPPWGTFAVLLVYIAVFAGLWGLMYVGLLVARGPVS
jgi:hypothetical protein